MPSKPKDPTEAIRLAASQYPEVDKGTACTQSSFKTGNKAFLFIGMQGGRCKAMFKLQKSIPQAERLASESPDQFQVGSTSWVTARFTSEQPLSKRIWKKWLDESYALCRCGKKKTTPKKKALAKKKVERNATQKKKARKVAKKTARKKL